MDEWSLVILTLLVLSLPSFRQVFFRKVEKKESAEVKERLVFFDILKGLAILAVIWIHVTFFFKHTEGLINNNNFINIANNLARFAISFFFICSGILLNPLKKSEWKNFYKRKVARIFVPYFLVSSFLFLAYPVSLKEFFLQLVRGEAAIPFYFVIVLLQMYLLYPLLQKWRYKKWFLSGSFFVSLIYFVSPIPEQPLDFPIFLPFLFLFCYGMYFRDRFLDYKANKDELFIWLMIIMADIILMVVGQDYYYNQRYFYGPALFNVLFFFRTSIVKQRWLSKTFFAFGKNSLWVYLVHFSLMWVFYPVFYNLVNNYYLRFISFFVFSAIISYLVGLLCSKVYEYAVKKLTVQKPAKL